MDTRRHIYQITKDKESFIGYLFTDNVLFWQRKGYTVKLIELIGALK